MAKRKPYEYIKLIPKHHGVKLASINGKDYKFIGGEECRVRKDHMDLIKEMGFEFSKPKK